MAGKQQGFRGRDFYRLPIDSRDQNPAHHAPAWFTLPVLHGVIFVKTLLSPPVFAAAGELGSNALQGDAWHHRSAAVTSAATAIGITVALIGGKGWEMADDWGALAACCVISTNAFLILKSSAYDAIDRAVAPELRAAISATAAACPECSESRSASSAGAASTYSSSCTSK